jgi:hypothetical protein
MHLVPKVKVTANSGLVFIGNIEKKEIVGADKITMLQKIARDVEGVREVHMHLIPVKEKPDHINPFYNM